MMDSTRTFRFLMVGDDPHLCEFIKFWCRSIRNIDVLVEICETETIAVQRMAMRTYDLILLDLEVPGLQGKTLYSYLKSRSKNRVTPVIILSELLENMSWAEDSSASLLKKPATHLEFKSLLTELLALDLIEKDYSPDAMAH